MILYVRYVCLVEDCIKEFDVYIRVLLILYIRLVITFQDVYIAIIWEDPDNSISDPISTIISK